MKVNAKDVHKILEHLALQDAVGEGHQVVGHDSRICRLPVKSWQADIIRETTGMPQALNPMELRRMMQEPDMPVIFLPDAAIVTREVIDQICAESPLNKMIIWETN